MKVKVELVYEVDLVRWAREYGQVEPADEVRDAVMSLVKESAEHGMRHLMEGKFPIVRYAARRNGPTIYR